jgi:hypothetical protein
MNVTRSDFVQRDLLQSKVLVLFALVAIMHPIRVMLSMATTYDLKLQ